MTPENVDRNKLRKAAHELAGFMKDTDTPDWQTPEATSAWVRSLRRESDERAFSRIEGTSDSELETGGEDI